MGSRDVIGCPSVFFGGFQERSRGVRGELNGTEQNAADYIRTIKMDCISLYIGL